MVNNVFYGCRMKNRVYIHGIRRLLMTISIVELHFLAVTGFVLKGLNMNENEQKRKSPGKGSTVGTCVGADFGERSGPVP